MTTEVEREEIEQREIYEGRQAQNVLNDKTLMEVLGKIETQARNDYEGTEPNQQSIREENYYLLRAVRKLKGELERKVKRGETAKSRSRKRAARAKKEFN